MTGPCRDDVCITCADELTPMTIRSLSEDGMTAHGQVDGENCEIALDLIDNAQVGDVLLTHGGVALQLAPSETILTDAEATAQSRRVGSGTGQGSDHG